MKRVLVTCSSSGVVARVGMAGLGLCFGLSLLMLTTSPASGVTSTTLYVDNVNGGATSGCSAPGAAACSTVQEGIDAAEQLSGAAVTLDVSGSSNDYGELVTVDLPATSGDSLSIVGTGPQQPTLNDGAGSIVTIAPSSAGAVSISNVDFGGGAAGAGNGGAIDNLGSGLLSVANDIFYGNSASGGFGGAIASGEGTNPGQLVVSNCTFTDNLAEYGGAIASGVQQTNANTVVINGGSVFSGNTATVDGGAIDSADFGTGSLTDDGSTYTQNSADDGGAIDSGDFGGSGSLSETASTFTNNASEDNGGAIDLGDDQGMDGSSGTPDTVAGSTFSGNTASADGGAIDGGDDGSTTLVVSGDTFSGNSAGSGFDHNGGAIDAADNGGSAALLVTAATFSDNSAPLSDGGAIDAQDGDGTGTITLENDTLSGNVSSTGGGIASWLSGSVENSTLTGNGAGETGGGIVYEGAITLVGDTISANTASAASGGGIANNSGTTSGTIADSLLAANSPGNCGGSPIGDGGYNVSSDTSCGFGPTGVNSSSTIGNLGLSANGSSGPQTESITTLSSAFGEVPSSQCTLSTDERGDPRPGTGETNCDAGAFELQAPSTSSPMTSSLGAPNGASTTSGQPTLASWESIVTFGSVFPSEFMP
jgi:predicted outer membrane repeat protein